MSQDKLAPEQKETPPWVLGGILLLTACLCVGAIALKQNSQGDLGQIHQSGALVAEAILSEVTSPYEIILEDQGRYNRISVTAEGIAVLEANCPDQVCVLQGYQNQSPILCLPHQVIISFSTELQWEGAEGGGLDGITG